MLLLALTGCVTLYKPNITHSPMLTEKGQGHIATSIGVTGCGLANLQADYAVSDHVGIMTNGMYHYRSDNVYTDTTLGSQKLNILYGEMGAGFFDKIGGSNKMSIQCYTGGGFGATNARINTNYNPEPSVSSNYYNFFVQPGFVFSQRFIEMAMDMRFKYVKLYNIEAVNYSAFDWWDTDLNYLEQADLDFVLFEPTFTFAGGGERLKGTLQTGFVIPIINSEAYFGTNSFRFFEAPVFKFSIGINYAFGKKRED